MNKPLQSTLSPTKRYRENGVTRTLKTLKILLGNVGPGFVTGATDDGAVNLFEILCSYSVKGPKIQVFLIMEALNEKYEMKSCYINTLRQGTV